LRKKRAIKKAVLGFRTNDLATFTNFMVEQLGFELVKYQPDADMAYILDIEGDLTLLAGPGVEDITAYLEYPDFALKPGSTMRFEIDDIEAQHRKLIERGMQNVTIKKGFAERVIRLKGPDDYIIEFAVETDDLVEDAIVFSAGNEGTLVVFHDAGFDEDVEEYE
jgi:catechol 2,3-dioxygenase-like lactoylglutathione lyase family enzyme